MRKKWVVWVSSFENKNFSFKINFTNFFRGSAIQKISRLHKKLVRNQDKILIKSYISDCSELRTIFLVFFLRRRSGTATSYLKKTLGGRRNPNDAIWTHLQDSRCWQLSTKQTQDEETWQFFAVFCPLQLAIKRLRQWKVLVEMGNGAPGFAVNPTE